MCIESIFGLVPICFYSKNCLLPEAANFHVCTRHKAHIRAPPSAHNEQLCVTVAPTGDAGGTCAGPYHNVINYLYHIAILSNQ